SRARSRAGEGAAEGARRIVRCRGDFVNRTGAVDEIGEGAARVGADEHYSVIESARALAARTGSSAWVTARPMTRRSAPAAMASCGVVTRAWSCVCDPAGRVPGTTAFKRGARPF